MTAITPTQFTENFPEFADAAMFPPSAITYWLTYAYILLPAARWGALLDLGAQLFAAHNLVLEAQAQQQAAQPGGLPGLSTGLVASTGVGAVSVSYDTASGVNPEDTHFNLTTFGTRFRQMMRDFGAGGLIINGCVNPAGLAVSGGFYQW